MQDPGDAAILLSRPFGRRVAAEGFDRVPGRWLTHQMPGNAAATAFWRAVIPVPYEGTSNARGSLNGSKSRANAPSSRGLGSLLGLDRRWVGELRELSDDLYWTT